MIFENFKKELVELVNKHTIENELSMPDFLIAEMICNFLYAIEEPMKKNLDWHNCNSLCHPKQTTTGKEGFNTHLDS